jgi:hypothetical protein
MLCRWCVYEIIIANGSFHVRAGFQILDDGHFGIAIHLKLQMVVYPVTVSLREHNTQMHTPSPHITTKSRQTNKNKNRSTHRATQTMKDILQPMTTA